MASVQELFSGLESRYRLPGGYLSRLYQIESNSGKDLTSKTSSAKGPFQFLDSTAESMGLRNPYDTEASADAAARLAVANRAFLQKRGFEDPDGRLLYLAHQQGAQGAVDILKAGDRPAVGILGEAAVKNNGGKADMPASAFANKVMGVYDGKSEKDGSYAALGTSAPIDSPDTADVLDESADKKERGTSSRESYALNVLLNASKGLDNRQQVAMLPIPRLSYATGGIAALGRGYATGGAATQVDLPATEKAAPAAEAPAADASNPLLKSLYGMIGMSDVGANDEGFKYWNDVYNKSGAEPVIQAFQAEARKSNPDFDKQQLVDSLYQGVLGRAADTGGRDYFVDRLKSGSSYSDLAFEMMKSPEYIAQYQNDSLIPELQTSDATGPRVQEAGLKTGTATDAISQASLPETSPSEWKTYFGYKPTAADYNRLLRGMLGENLAGNYEEYRGLTEALGNRLAANQKNPSWYKGAKTLAGLVTPDQVEGIKNDKGINNILLAKDQNSMATVAQAKQALDDYFTEGQNRILTTQTDWMGFDKQGNPSPGTGRTGRVAPGESTLARYNTFYLPQNSDVGSYLDDLQAKTGAVYIPPASAKALQGLDLAGINLATRGLEDASVQYESDAVSQLASNPAADPFSQTGLNPVGTASTTGTSSSWADQQIQDNYSLGVNNLIADAARGGVAGWGINGATGSDYGSGYGGITLSSSPYPFVDTGSFDLFSPYAGATGFSMDSSNSSTSDYVPFADGGEVKFTPMFEGDRPEFQEEAKKLGKQAYADIGSLSPQQLQRWKAYAEVYNLPLSTVGSDNSYEDQVSSYMRSLQENPPESKRNRYYADGGSVLGGNMEDDQNNMVSTMGVPDYGDYVQSLYGNLGRSGMGTGANQIDPGGYDYWTNALNTGTATKEGVAQSFADYLKANPVAAAPAAPASTLTGPASTTSTTTSAIPDYGDYVKLQYSNLGRAGFGTGQNQIDQGGYDYWTNLLNTGAASQQDVAGAFSKQGIADTGNYVQSLYGNLGRTDFGTGANQIDQGGYDYWTNLINSGATTKKDVANAFERYLNTGAATSTNTGAATGTNTGTTTDTNTGTTTDTNTGTTTGTNTGTTGNTASSYADYVKSLYGTLGRTTFGEDPGQIDKAGFDYWTNQLASGAATKDQVSAAFAKILAASKKTTTTTVIPTTKTGAPDFNQIVLDAYSSIGRKGFGTDMSAIDKAGYDYWLGKLTSGEISPENFNDAFKAGVKDIVSKDDDYAKYIQNYQKNSYDVANFRPKEGDPAKVSSSYDPYTARNFVVSKPTADFKGIGNDLYVKSMYGNIGRKDIGTAPDQIDLSGLNYWTNALNTGAASKADVSKAFADTPRTVQKPPERVTTFPTFTPPKQTEPVKGMTTQEALDLAAKLSKTPTKTP